jgi:hypothetical protein
MTKKYHTSVTLSSELSSQVHFQHSPKAAQRGESWISNPTKCGKDTPEENFYTRFETHFQETENED